MFTPNNICSQRIFLKFCHFYVFFKTLKLIPMLIIPISWRIIGSQDILRERFISSWTQQLYLSLQPPKLSKGVFVGNQCAIGGFVQVALVSLGKTMKICVMKEVSSQPGVGKLFYKGAACKYFRPCRPYYVCHNYSTLLLEHERSHRQCINE